MTVPLLQLPRTLTVDANGEPRSNAKLYTFAAQTTNPVVVWQDPSLTIPHPVPIRSNAEGTFPPIYADPTLGDLKINITDEVDVQIPGYPIDNIPAPFDSSQATISKLLTPQTKAENSLGVFPVNYGHPAGHVYRYGVNTTPGTTDMTVAINTAANVCRGGNYTLQLPSELCLVSATLDWSNIKVVGPLSPFQSNNVNIKATSAQFNVVKSTGSTTIENVGIDGGWDQSTPGLTGDTLFLEGPSGICYSIHFYNVLLIHNKHRGIYWQGSGYSHFQHVESVSSGLDGLFIDGSGVASTTVHIDGQSRFSDCPNGHSVIINNGVALMFQGAIMENTKGIQIQGNNNRALTFDGVYQEGTIGGSFLDSTGAAGIGLRVTGCYGAATSAITNITGWVDVFFDGNSALVEPPIPFANRIAQADGGQLSTTTTGGVSVTAAQITLGPGVWMLFATLQTLEGVTGVLSQSACQITTDVSASGLNNGTADGVFTVAADQANYTPGTSEDVRLNAFTIVAPTTSTTYYLRARFNISAGTLGYRGFLNAVLFK